MPNSPSSLQFYRPGLSSRQPDGSLSFSFSGWEGDQRFSGNQPILADDPDFPFWAWLHAHRGSFPRSFEKRFIPALRHSFQAGHDRFVTPADGIYLVTAEWSGPSRMLEQAFRSELAKRDPPLPFHCVETDSAEVDDLFPQLRPFLHGYGEVIAFENGKCDLFDSRGIRNADIPAFINSVYQSFP